KAIEMKPRSAPENGAFEPPSSKRIAGTEPAPMKTSSPVPMASAPRRWARECSTCDNLLRPAGRPAGRSAVSRPPSARNEIRHSRTPFGRDYDGLQQMCQADRREKVAPYREAPPGRGFSVAGL